MGHRQQHRQEEKDHRRSPSHELGISFSYPLKPAKPVLTSSSKAMWRHPITAKQIRVLSKDWGVKDTDAINGEGTAAATTESAQSEGWFQVINVSFSFIPRIVVI